MALFGYSSHQQACQFPRIQKTKAILSYKKQIQMQNDIGNSNGIDQLPTGISGNHAGRNAGLLMCVHEASLTGNTCA
jgi:hypothetical protein